MTVPDICNILSQAQYHLQDEAGLQLQISEVLKKEGIKHTREVELSPKNRIDFLLENNVGIEVKINRAGTALLYQISRYTQEEKIKELLVITIRPAALPKEINGRKIYGLALWNRLDFV